MRVLFDQHRSKKMLKMWTCLAKTNLLLQENCFFIKEIAFVQNMHIQDGALSFYNLVLDGVLEHPWAPDQTRRTWGLGSIFAN